jgi:fructose-1,6-bisphosphatase
VLSLLTAFKFENRKKYCNLNSQLLPFHWQNYVGNHSLNELQESCVNCFDIGNWKKNWIEKKKHSLQMILNTFDNSTHSAFSSTNNFPDINYYMFWNFCSTFTVEQFFRACVQFFNVRAHGHNFWLAANQMEINFEIIFIFFF